MLILYLLVIGVVGFAVTAGIFGPSRRRLIELVACSAAFGCGATPILLIWISLAGVRPTRGVIIGIGIAAITIILILAKLRRLPSIARPIVPKLCKLDWILVPVGALILIQLAAAASSAASFDAYETDAIAIWGLKAKVLYNEPLRPLPSYFRDLSLSYSHLDYPLLLPMLWAGAYGSIGGVDDRAGRLVLLIPMIAIALMVYAALRDGLGRQRSALLAAISLGTPAMARWAGQGVADVTLAPFIVSAAILLARWLRESVRVDAFAAGLFASMAASTKLEGSVIAVAVIAIVLFARRRLVGCTAALIGLLIASEPWLMTRGLPHTHENYASRITPQHLGNGIGKIPSLIELLFSRSDLTGFVPVLILLVLCAVLTFRSFKRAQVLGIWVMLLVQLLGYFVAYLVTPWELQTLVPMTAQRLVLQITPLAVFLAGLHWQTNVLTDS